MVAAPRKLGVAMCAGAGWAFRVDIVHRASAFTIDDVRVANDALHTLMQSTGI